MEDELISLKRTESTETVETGSSKRLKLDALDSSPTKEVKIDSDENFGITGSTNIGPEINAEGDSASNAKEISEADGALEKKSRNEKNTSRRRDAAGYAKARKGKDKDEKNIGRRSRRGTRNEEDQAKEGMDGASDGKQVPKAARLPKRQCALLIGFCGTGCSGMQIQPNARTIEGVLFDALVKAGAVSQDNADDPVKVNLGRAARTDAGVHAAGNLVSLKMITSIPSVPDIVARVNEELPPEIRFWGYVRVQNSFNARVMCDSRKYTYFFPTYLLIPPKPGSSLDRILQQSTESSISEGRHPFWSEVNPETTSKESDLLRKRRWRIGPDQIQALRDAARRYEGTHNFHNFTVGREFSDRSNQRHMKKIEISEPAVYGETEWISVLFHGQSFMLHQIRKMMSALILSCRTRTPHQVIDELYGPRTVFVPKMPSLGLLLEYPIFDSYNSKVVGINQNLDLSDPDYRPPIDFELYREKIDKFKQTFIYDNMRAIEDRDGLFDAWIRSLDAYGGNDLLYLNSKGVVPPAAVIKKGVRRDNPFKEKKRFDATSFPAGGSAIGDTHEDDEDEDETLLNKRGLADTEG